MVRTRLSRYKTAIWTSVLFVVISIPWWVNVQYFVADDSYFYLETAKNIALTGRQTFSGLYPTNGLHPLWLYLLSLYSWLVSFLNPGILGNPTFAVPLSAALLALGALNFWKVAKILRVNKLLFVSIPLMHSWLFRVLYSEGHLFYFCLSFLTLIALNGVREKKYGHLLIGIACTLVFLSRLDSMFFVAAFFVWYFAVEKNRVRVVVSAVVSGLVVLPYLLSNMVWFGGLTPISGWLKSSFPSICWTLRFCRKGPLSIELFGYQVVFGMVPIIASIFVVLALRKRITADASIVYALR